MPRLPLTGCDCMRERLVLWSYAGSQGPRVWLGCQWITFYGERKLKMQGCNWLKSGTDLEAFFFCIFTPLCSKFSQICCSWVWTELEIRSQAVLPALCSFYPHPHFHLCLGKDETELRWAHCQIQTQDMPNWFHITRKMQLFQPVSYWAATAGDRLVSSVVSNCSRGLSFFSRVMDACSHVKFVQQHLFSKLVPMTHCHLVKTWTGYQYIILEQRI